MCIDYFYASTYEFELLFIKSLRLFGLTLLDSSSTNLSPKKMFLFLSPSLFFKKLCQKLFSTFFLDIFRTLMLLLAELN